MLETLKKRTRKNLLWRVVIAVIIIIAVSFYCGKAILLFVQGPAPITAGMDYDAADGSYVSFDAKYIIDEYVRRSEKNTDTHKETLKNIGYFVYFDEDGYFFGIELPASKETEMNGYIDDTLNWLNEEVDDLTKVIPVKGTWTKLTGKRLNYYKEQITSDLGDDFLQIALPYYIDTGKAGDRSFASIYSCMAVLALTLIFLIYNLIRYFAGSSKKNLKKYTDNNPLVSMEYLEADFASATAVTTSLWIGRRWTFYISGIYAKLLENKNLVWGYYYCRTGRYSESTLRLFDIDRQRYNLSASKKEATAALNLYGQQAPQMIPGYSSELEKMYQKDFQGFLNLRYNLPPEDFETRYPSPWDYTNPEKPNSKGSNSEGLNSEGSNSEVSNSEGSSLEGSSLEGSNSEGSNSEGLNPEDSNLENSNPEE